MIQAFATSDVGKEREINEDYFYISFPDDNVLTEWEVIKVEKLQVNLQ